MSLDHEAIYEAYKSEAKPVVRIFDDPEGAFDADGNKITLDQSKIDAARTSLNAAAAAIKYKTDRTTNGSITYDTIGNQLDQLFHDMKDGKLGVAATTGSWYVGITSVKNNFPKPS